MAYIRCNLSGGGVKKGTLNVTVSGTNNNPYTGIDFSSPGTPNNYFSNNGKVTISLDGTELGTVEFNIHTNANLHPSQSGVSYIRTSISGSGTVVLK